jgi:hypothetical protein
MAKTKKSDKAAHEDEPEPPHESPASKSARHARSA